MEPLGTTRLLSSTLTALLSLIDMVLLSANIMYDAVELVVSISKNSSRFLITAMLLASERVRGLEEASKMDPWEAAFMAEEANEMMLL